MKKTVTTRYEALDGVYLNVEEGAMRAGDPPIRLFVNSEWRCLTPREARTLGEALMSVATEAEAKSGPPKYVLKDL